MNVNFNLILSHNCEVDKVSKKTKIRFDSLSDRDKHLKVWGEGSYEIDSKNPLVVWLL